VKVSSPSEHDFVFFFVTYEGEAPELCIFLFFFFFFLLPSFSSGFALPPPSASSYSFDPPRFNLFPSSRPYLRPSTCSCPPPFFESSPSRRTLDVELFFPITLVVYLPLKHSAPRFFFFFFFFRPFPFLVFPPGPPPSSSLQPCDYSARPPMASCFPVPAPLIIFFFTRNMDPPLREQAAETRNWISHPQMKAAFF